MLITSVISFPFLNCRICYLDLCCVGFSSCVCCYHLGVCVLLRYCEAELFNDLAVDNGCAVGNCADCHCLGVCAVEDLNAHLSGLFAESDVVDADGSQAAVLYLLDLGAVNRDIGSVSLLENNGKVVYNVVIGEVIDDQPGKVVMTTEIGTQALLPQPGGELLPRIC